MKNYAWVIKSGSTPESNYGDGEGEFKRCIDYSV